MPSNIQNDTPSIGSTRNIRVRVDDQIVLNAQLQNRCVPGNGRLAEIETVEQVLAAVTDHDLVRKRPFVFEVINGAEFTMKIVAAKREDVARNCSVIEENAPDEPRKDEFQCVVI